MASYSSCCVSRSAHVGNPWDGIWMGHGARKVSSLSLPADDYRHKKFNSALLPKRRSVVPTFNGRITRTATANSAAGVASSIRQLKINSEPRKMRRFLSESDDNDHAMTVTTTSQDIDSNTNLDEEEVAFTFYRNAEIGLGAISSQKKANKKTVDPPWNWERRLSTEVWPDVSIIPVVAPGGNRCAQDHSSSSSSLESCELLDSSFRFRVNTVDRTSSWINEQAGRKKRRMGQVKRHTITIVVKICGDCGTLIHKSEKHIVNLRFHHTVHYNMA